jgi:signal transduction histidine kinase
MGLLLRGAGHSILEAANGSDALDLARRGVSLVLLDVNLPDISGYDVCRRLRATEDTRHLPVLLVSAVFVHSDDRSQGLEGGADAYLIKPVEPRELLATVRALLRVHAAEEAARAAAQQWQATFDAISDAVCLLDADGVIVRGNHAAGALLGCEPAMLAGMPWLQAVQVGLHLPAPPGEIAGAGPAGREHALGGRWFRAAGHAIHDANGRPAGRVQVLTDVTRVKELEEQRRQGQRLEALGRLAGGIAHDFNNLLTVILGNASLLLQHFPPGDASRPLAQTIEHAGLRAGDLTRQLLGFARQTPLHLRATDLNAAVAEAVGMLRRTIDPRVTLETRLASDLWPVQADPGQVTQVLLNLCLNARDALVERLTGPGGRLALATANHAFALGEIPAHVESLSGEFVCLSVEDNGPGIAEDIRPRIFDPFFTTKPTGKGTGLGLAMVFGTVQQHHGWVECHSESGRGTRFDVYLPRAVPADETLASTRTARAKATVLVVDDVPMLRDLAAAFLGHGGFEVVLAEDGRRAIEIYKHQRGQIDLVLLDVRMPGLNGPATLRELRAIDPGVQVVFTSGYAEGMLGSPEQEGAQGFVAKPYCEEELLAAVRTALGQLRPRSA